MSRRSALLFFAALASIVLAVSPGHASPGPRASASAATSSRFEVDDYFQLRQITELAMSSDGNWLAYAVQARSLKENKPVRQVYVHSLAAGAEPILLISSPMPAPWLGSRADTASLFFRVALARSKCLPTTKRAAKSGK